MSEQSIRRPISRRQASSGTFRIIAVLVLAVVVGGIVWLSTRSNGGSSASQPTRTVSAVSVAQLDALAAKLGHPIFWVGPRPGVTYELTQSSNGTLALRYLPKNVALGSATPYLTVATYPFSGAFVALQAVGKQAGATSVALPSGGLAIVSSSQPDNIHAAYPNVDYQAEIFAPKAGAAESLAAHGKLAAIGSLTSGSAAVPSAATRAQLKALAGSLQHPVYWAGPVAGNTYELTQSSDGKVYIRYLPKGSPVGTPSGELTVATYPFAGAFTALQALAGQKGVDTFKLKGGGIALVDAGNPKSIHLAYPGVAFQVEVFDPSPAVVRRLVKANKIVNVG